ncbi:MAG: vanadium-dependent haloperoxidase [Acaryochloridaceae cyanobacterium RL_2_7]|nr:vanadium-dependent haloperoxidase [Acaryochloridaceae cyanobacterium RL_2_7]
MRLLGGLSDTQATTLMRTDDQTDQAFFWAYDRIDSFRPFGHLNQITQEIALREGNSVEENARLFALLNISLADAAIVAWKAKYNEMQPRPDDVISGDGGIPFSLIDGFDETVTDPDWEPLLGAAVPAGGSPAFPDYISGHATFGGAFAWGH